MAFQYAGHDIEVLELTYAYGLAPAGARVRIPGSVSVAVGTDFTVTIGGLSFYGVVNQNPVETNNGSFTDLQLVDNRIRLMWDDVYCTFNNSEVRPDNPATPGIDRQKRFWHILPDDWDAQIKTWTDEPMTAGEIIDTLLYADTVNYSWARTLHASQSKPVYNVGDGNGTKLGTMLEDIASQQGLVFTLAGSNTLVFVKKGTGTLPTIPATSTDRKIGEALSNKDTAVRIVGDRNKYQDMPIDLVPDWKAAYQPFWAEPAWIAEVDGTWGPWDETDEDQADLFAFAKSVTMREYAVEKGDPAYVDYGLWGEVSRMEIPVWLYLQDVVWKAYRVPYSYTVNGIGLEDLQLNEGMIAAVVSDVESGEIALKSPREYYPEGKAYVIAQGQPLDILDARTQGGITPDQLAAGRTLWSPQNKFNLDVKNNVVIFEHPVIVPGAGAAGLFVFPNQGVSGISETHPLYNIAVPNAAVTLAAANVRAVLVFEAEKFSKRYGSGVRNGPKYVSSLNYHALMDGGAFQEEVKYADNKTVVQKSDEYAGPLIAQEEVYAAGGYTRHGAAGTALNGMIDRVTISITFSEYLTERVEFTKERAAEGFQHEREMDRQPRTHELYPGQKKNRSEVENLQIIAKASRELKRRSPSGYRSISEVTQKPVGCSHSAPRTIKLTGSRSAGEVIWTNAATGDVDDEGPCFAGVVIAEGSSGNGVSLATQGVVPVRVQGPFAAGDSVGQNGSIVEVSGERLVGVVNESYEGSEIAVVPVRLGAGNSRKDLPFLLKPVTETIDEGGNTFSVRVVASTLAGDYPLGIYPSDDPIFKVMDDIVNEGVICGKLTINPSTGAVTTREVRAYEEKPNDNEDDGEYYVVIGGFKVEDNVLTVNNAAYGPITASICPDYFQSPPRYNLTFLPSTYFG